MRYRGHPKRDRGIELIRKCGDRVGTEDVAAISMRLGVTRQWVRRWAREIGMHVARDNFADLKRRLAQVAPPGRW